MAEGRMLKKKISLNQELADLKNDTHRLLFTWALAHADVEGRLSGEARVFKATVCPLLEDIKTSHIDEFFLDAQALGLIEYYEIGGRRFISFPGFKENQKLNPSREASSKIPASTGEIKEQKIIGKYGYYGAGWEKRKDEIRERDKVCRICSKTPEENQRALEVHHLKPFKDFMGDHEAANHEDNLVALCQICHLKIRVLNEESVRTQCGLHDYSPQVKLSKDKLKEAIYARSTGEEPPNKTPPKSPVGHFEEKLKTTDEPLFQELLLAAQDPILQTIQFNAHQFIQRNKAKHPRAILHAIDQVRRAAHKGIPVKPWPYAEKILRVESKNYTEAEAITGHLVIKDAMAKMYPRQKEVQDEN